MTSALVKQQNIQVIQRPPQRYSEGAGAAEQRKESYRSIYSTLQDKLKITFSGTSVKLKVL